MGQAELLARKCENSAISGEDLKPAKMPTMKEAVGVFLADAEARGLAPATLQKLRSFFQVQLLGFAEESGITFLARTQSSQLHGMAANLEREGTRSQEEVRTRDRLLLVFACGKAGYARIPRQPWAG